MDAEYYIAEVSRIITTNFKPQELLSGMTAARAGLLVRQSLNVEPLTAGYAKFGDVLRELARRDLVRVGPNAKSVLAIWPPTERAPVEAPKSAVCNRTPAPRFRKLRNSLWLAFIAESPVGRRFMHRRTGEIKMGQEKCPEPADDWVEVQRFDQSSERDDAYAFLKKEGKDDNQRLVGALNSAHWWRDFAEALKGTDVFLSAEWNRRRSQRVIARAEDWRKANHIDADLLYVMPPSPRAPITPLVAGRDSRLREALVAAVRQMSTEELLELRLPAKHLVLSLCPDLLSR